MESTKSCFISVSIICWLSHVLKLWVCCSNVSQADGCGHCMTWSVVSSLVLHRGQWLQDWNLYLSSILPVPQKPVQYLASHLCWCWGRLARLFDLSSQSMLFWVRARFFFVIQYCCASCVCILFLKYFIKLEHIFTLLNLPINIYCHGL